jgi:TIGR03009 family protein
MQNAKCRMQKCMTPIRIALLPFASCILHFAFLVGPTETRAQEYPAWGQASPPQYRQPAPLPDQPIIPSSPSFERRPTRSDADAMGAPLRGDIAPNTMGVQPGYRDPRLQTPPTPAAGPRQQLPYPFDPPLTRRQEDDLQRLLLDWEQQSALVKTFECKFTRFEYDTFDPTGRRRPDQPKAIDKGEIKYAAPDKAMFQIPGEKGEYWVCDGKAIYEQDPLKKQMIVHRLPPELQGRAIADGPVPFLFGAKAAKLVGRYYMRITPPEEIKPEARNPNQVWLEAWPRSMADAQNFKYAELILDREKGLTPTHARIHHPNGNHYVRYAMESIAINKSPGVFGGVTGAFEEPWWRPRAPRGWQTVVDEPPQVPQQPMGRQAPPSVGTRFQDSR